MLIGIPKESRNNENRVAITPEILKKIIKLGYQVQIEKSAGRKSSFPDQLYLDQGASVVESKEIWKSTKGYFDPTIGNIVNAYGFGVKKGMKSISNFQKDSLKNITGFENCLLYTSPSPRDRG